MSKIEIIHKKFPGISNSTFNFFVESDFTGTNKYLEYMLYYWDTYKHFLTKAKFVDMVKDFDELLPYIDNKDIYSLYYKDISHFLRTVENAKSKKEEKSFVKGDNIFVIHETQTFLLLYPKTFTGSAKYGANTRWCTTSQGNASSFEKYSKGFLVYLIDKTGKRTENYKKIAFHVPDDSGINLRYDIYNQIDNKVEGKTLLVNRWEESEVIEIDTVYRNFIHNFRKLKKAKNEVDTVIKYISTINFQELEKNLKILDIGKNINLNGLNENLKNLNESLSKLKFSKAL